MTDPETIARAVLSRLQTHLPASLDAIDAEAADGLVLEDPVEYVLGDKLLILDSPTVCVDIDRDHLTYAPGAVGTMETTLMVGVVMQDLDRDQLSLRLWRTLRAVREVLQDQTLGGLVQRLYVDDVQYTDATQVPSGKAFIKGGAVVLRALQAR